MNLSLSALSKENIENSCSTVLLRSMRYAILEICVFNWSSIAWVLWLCNLLTWFFFFSFYIGTLSSRATSSIQKSSYIRVYFSLSSLNYDLTSWYVTKKKTLSYRRTPMHTRPMMARVPSPYIVSEWIQSPYVIRSYESRCSFSNDSIRRKKFSIFVIPSPPSLTAYIRWL